MIPHVLQNLTNLPYCQCPVDRNAEILTSNGLTAFHVPDKNIGSHGLRAATNCANPADGGYCASMETNNKQLILGRREWISLPDLGLAAIKAKIDTGAKTSSLHARNIKLIGSASRPRVRFTVHPIPMRPKIAIACEADVIDERAITSSNGAQERRLIIRTAIRLGDRTWRVEMGLTDRSVMTSRCLLGRQAIPADMLVDPSSSFLQPRLSSRLYSTRT